MEESSRKVDVKSVIGDGAYDSRRNFNILDEKDVESIIKVRRNAIKRLRGCPARRKVLRCIEAAHKSGGGSTA